MSDLEKCFFCFLREQPRFFGQDISGSFSSVGRFQVKRRSGPLLALRPSALSFAAADPCERLRGARVCRQALITGSATRTSTNRVKA